jgi:hypothetical protein
MALQQQQAQIT